MRAFPEKMDISHMLKNPEYLLIDLDISQEKELEGSHSVFVYKAEWT